MESIPGLRDEEVRVAGFNPVSYIALDDGNVQERRQVVDRELCNACHGDLALHGTIRQNPEYCVMCHNPLASDEAVRPAEAMPPASINFRVLIHRIHNGAASATGLQVYGFGGSLHDFSQVVFPGNLSNCQNCHLANAYGLPLGPGVLGTTITQEAEVVFSTAAVKSVCTACHDAPAAEGHIDLQTTPEGIETCEVCHGPGREFDVVRIHD